MALLVEPEFWARLFGIGVLNLLLSGDNALVIALAVRALPPKQRVLGQIWGALGAVALRVVFVAIVTLLLRVPLLQDRKSTRLNSSHDQISYAVFCSKEKKLVDGSQESTVLRADVALV